MGPGNVPDHADLQMILTNLGEDLLDKAKDLTGWLFAAIVNLDINIDAIDRDFGG